MLNFVNKQDNTAPLPSGLLTAAEDNVRFNELENGVTTAGITLDENTSTDLFMLAQAMARYASGGIFCRDTGGANTYVLSTPKAFRLSKAYFTGLMVMFHPGAANTGPSTVNYNSIGAKKVFNSVGDALAAGDIATNTLTLLTYDETLDEGSGAFKISPWSMPMRSVGNGVAVYEGMKAGRQKIRSVIAGTGMTIDLVEYPAASGEYGIRFASSGGGGGGSLTDGDKGDITVSSSASVWTIDPDVVDNTKAANMPANTFKARLSTLGDPQDLTGTQAAQILPDAASGVKGMVTPDGNVGHFLNGTGAWSTPAASFPIFPAPGSYTMQVVHNSSLYSLVAVGDSKNATGTGSWYEFGVNPALPAGVWKLVGLSQLNESSGSGGTSETVPGTLAAFQRTS